MADQNLPPAEAYRNAVLMDKARRAFAARYDPSKKRDALRIVEIMEGRCDHTPAVKAEVGRLWLEQPQIIYGDSDDIEMSDAEFEMLMDIGHAIVGTLGEFAKEGSSIDTGVGCGEYEAFVTVGDLEYKVAVRPYCRESEIKAELAAMGELSPT